MSTATLSADAVIPSCSWIARASRRRSRADSRSPGACRVKRTRAWSAFACATTAGADPGVRRGGVLQAARGLIQTAQRAGEQSDVAGHGADAEKMWRHGDERGGGSEQVVKLRGMFSVGEESSGLSEKGHRQQRLHIAPDCRPVVAGDELEHRLGGRAVARLALQPREQASIDTVGRVGSAIAVSAGRSSSRRRCSRSSGKRWTTAVVVTSELEERSPNCCARSISSSASPKRPPSSASSVSWTATCQCADGSRNS